MGSSDRRKALENRLKELEQEREVAKEAYLNAPMDKDIAAQRIADIFRNKQEIREAEQQLRSAD